MAIKSATFRLAPPMRAPSTSGKDKNSLALPGFTEPPYKMRILLAIAFAELFGQDLADGSVNFFNIGRGRGFSGTDGPNRLISNNGIGSSRIIGNGAHNLLTANINRFARIALFEGFADANNGF